MHRLFPVLILLAAVARDLMEKLARGDVRALRALYDDLAPTAMSLAWRILRDRAEAEDVVQESFLEVWRRAATYKPDRRGVSGWIVTMVRNRCIDRLRARSSAAHAANAAAAQPPPVPGPAPLELATRRQERERVQAALEQLPAEQRAAIELAYFEGLTHSEIAARFGLPLGTVKTRMRLAMEKLAATLAGTEVAA